jgi:beta-galactosidase
VGSVGSPDPSISRRALLRGGLLGGASLALPSLAPAPAQAQTRRRQPRSAPSFPTATYDFNQGWRFGGAYTPGAQNPGWPDAGWTRVTLPHTVTPLSWGEWQPGSWERQWVYHKHFSGASLQLGRTFLDFDGVMSDARVFLNGFELAEHLGGYLPFSVELTPYLLPGENVLAVIADGRWLDSPPQGDNRGPISVDYLQPAGIYRDVRLRSVPEVFISDVFAKPTGVASAQTGLEIQVTIDAAVPPGRRVQLTVELLDGGRRIAAERVERAVGIGSRTVSLALAARGVSLWSPTSPKLYTLRVTLSARALPTHSVQIMTGFREARFEVDGLYLNGERLQIFGLNRHQLFPYTGMAAPARLQARDAQLLRYELNCNMVRCSHYPQSPHFLDECDRIGLMVWEEIPGWQYMGDPSFQQTVLQNVHDMVIRDRNRPSVIVWGTRLDESGNYPTLYAQARALAYQLDGSRQTTGAMGKQDTTGWNEDLFAYDDYNTVDGNATLEPPINGIPYMVSEAVGALDGPPLYRWVDSSQTLAAQGRMHAQVQQIARSNPAYAGLLAWCAIDYASLVGAPPGRVWQNLRWPGVLDTFRVPKPGAAFYRSQQSPALAPVILPMFYWDFGPDSPGTGPGPGSIIATNCEVLEIYIGGQLLTSATPDTADYGNLAYPPVVVDLTVSDGSSLPDLKVIGLIAGRQVATLQMSSNPAGDRLSLVLDDAVLMGDGNDATRATFRALDAYGNQRPYVDGEVTLSLSGPAALIGQNPFQFELYGGVGGAFIRPYADARGTVTLTARHPTLGLARAQLQVLPARGRYL